MNKRICDIKAGVMFKLDRTGETYIKMPHGPIVDESGKPHGLHHLAKATPIKTLEEWEIVVLKEKYAATFRPKTTEDDTAKAHANEIQRYKEVITVLRDRVATLSTENESLRTILYHIAKTFLKSEHK